VNVAPEPSVSPSDSTSSPLPTPTPVQHSPSSSSSSASNPAHTPVGFLAGPQTGDGVYITPSSVGLR
jgi:hypothetical protein